MGNERSDVKKNMQSKHLKCWDMLIKIFACRFHTIITAVWETLWGKPRGHDEVQNNYVYIPLSNKVIFCIFVEILPWPESKEEWVTFQV
jgi:hypothetical protein